MLFLQAVQVHGRVGAFPLQGACGEEGDAVQQGEFCTQRLSA